MTEQEMNERQEQRMTTLTKAATILTKIFSVAYDIGAVSMIVGLVLFVVDRGLYPDTLVKGNPSPGQSLKIHGFSIVFGNADGSINNTAMILFLVAGAIFLELTAWIFRNVNLILRTTQGLTKFSVGKTPFQKDNVRRLREIGIFFIANTVVRFACTGLAAALIGPGMVESGGVLQDILLGILMLCLSQWVALGTRLQEDVDGLV